MATPKFEENKTYYLRGQHWKLKYTGIDVQGYWNFKVTSHKDPDLDWDGFSTKDPKDIMSNRAEWLLSISDEEERLALEHIEVAVIGDDV